MDLSQTVVLVGSHYVAIGEHADLWIGDMSNKKVAVKVLRGGSSSNPEFLGKFKQVSYGSEQRPSDTDCDVATMTTTSISILESSRKGSQDLATA